VTGEVSSIGTNSINISSQVASDGTNTLFAITNGSTPGNIIGAKSSASYAIVALDGFNALDDNDPYADNADFESVGNNFIDFTETNPFGEPNVTS
jgi:hypothetical protein